MSGEKVTGERIFEGVRVLFTERGYEPPMFPAVALELHALTRRPDVALSDIRKLVESDALLAARVLKLTRSPAFTGRVYVATLHDAIVRLGLETLSMIFMEVAVTSRIFRPPSPAYRKAMNGLRLHAVLSAHACRRLCHALGLPDDGAFVCGLLHDVGSAMGLVALSTPKLFFQTPPFEDVGDELRDVHVPIGEFVARAWALPPDVIDAIRAHHVDGGSMLAQIVRIASELARAVVENDERPELPTFGEIELDSEALDEVWSFLRSYRESALGRA